MNPHRQMEAKRARRRKRLAAETPHQRERREVAAKERVNAGAARMGEAVAPLARAEREAAKARLRALEQAGRPPIIDPLVPVPCACSPAKPHGVHWIKRSVALTRQAEAQRDAWAA